MAECDVEALMESAACLDGLEQRDIDIVQAQLLCEIYGVLTEEQPILWQDLRVSATSTKLGGSKDPDWVQFATTGTGSRGVYTYAFDKALIEEVFFNVQLPHGWTYGTDLRFHVHWATSGTDTSGNVVWGLEYTWANINGTYGNTTRVGIADAPDGVSHKHHMTSAIVIPGAGKTASSMIIARLFRDNTNVTGAGPDLYDEDAFLLEADFHYQVDNIGDTIAQIEI